MDTAGMNYIVKTEGFTVAVAAQKNRVYCTLEAVNAALPKFSEISDAWLEVGSYLTDRFTLVLDAGIEKIQHPALIGFLLATQGHTAVPTIKRKLDMSLPASDGGGVGRTGTCIHER